MRRAGRAVVNDVIGSQTPNPKSNQKGINSYGVNDNYLRLEAPPEDGNHIKATDAQRIFGGDYNID